MIYYKVKSKKDIVRIYGKNNIFKYFELITNDFLVANELIAKKELNNILSSKNSTIYNFECSEFTKNKMYYTKNEIISTLFDKVEVNKNKTYFCFGARFEIVK